MEKLTLTSDQITKYGIEVLNYLLGKSNKVSLRTLSTHSWCIEKEENDVAGIEEYELETIYNGSKLCIQIALNSDYFSVLLYNNIFIENGYSIYQSFYSGIIWFERQNCSKEMFYNRYKCLSEMLNIQE